MTDNKKQWQRLTAERKFRIFLETRKIDAPSGRSFASMA
jgi:hypothetical protein